MYQDVASKYGFQHKATPNGAKMMHPKHGEVSVNQYGEWHHFPKGSAGAKANGETRMSLDKHLSSLKEAMRPVSEKINMATASTSDVIHDFVHSKNSKFAGKSKKERINMALGAKYAKEESETPVKYKTLSELMAEAKVMKSTAFGSVESAEELKKHLESQGHKIIKKELATDQQGKPAGVTFHHTKGK